MTMTAIAIISVVSRDNPIAVQIKVVTLFAKKATKMIMIGRKKLYLLKCGASVSSIYGAGNATTRFFPILFA